MLAESASDITLPVMSSGQPIWIAGTAMRFARVMAIMVPQVLAVSTASRITPPAGIVMASAWGRMVSEKAAIAIGNRRMDSDLAIRPPTSAPSSPDAPTRPYAMPYAVEPNPSTVRTM